MTKQVPNPKGQSNHRLSVTPKCEWILLTLILCLAAALRLCQLDSVPPGLTHDEANYIPDAVSIVGFDNIDPAKSVTPALTTMHVDKIGMGRLAVQLLINRVEYPDASPVTAVIRPYLVERKSVQSL